MALVVNGNIYAFDRGTYKLRWRAEGLHQMLVLEQFQDLPMLLLTARYQKATGLRRHRSRRSRTGFMLCLGSRFPWGRPRCEATTRRAPF